MSAIAEAVTSVETKVLSKKEKFGLVGKVSPFIEDLIDRSDAQKFSDGDLFDLYHKINQNLQMNGKAAPEQFTYNNFLNSYKAA